MNCSTVVATIEIIEKSHFNDMWQGNTKARGSSLVSLILVAGTTLPLPLPPQNQTPLILTPIILHSRLTIPSQCLPPTTPALSLIWQP